MNLLNYTTSGTISFGCPQLGAPIPILSSGIVYIFNDETRRIEETIHFDGTEQSVPILITGSHISKTTYCLIPASYGFIGHSRVYSGALAPTTLVFQDDLQHASGLDVSGTLVFSKDFEDSSLSDMTVTVTGGGSLGTSGIISATDLDGSKYLGLSTSLGNNALLAQPTTASASGITCGRSTFLARPGTGTNPNSTLECVGFDFMNQDTTLTGTSYNVLLRPTTPASLTSFSLILGFGTIYNGSTTRETTILANTPIDFTTQTIRDANRKIWVIVEWESVSSPTAAMYFNVYVKLYESGDTATSIKTSSNTKLIKQVIYTGGSSGANFFTTTTTGKPAWHITGNTGAGILGLDDLYLETIPNISRKGLFRHSLLDKSSAGSARPFIINRVSTSGTASTTLYPYPVVTDVNYLTKAANSPYGIDAVGFTTGISFGGGVNTPVAAFFEISETGSNSMVAGTFRIFGKTLGTEATVPKIGFSFLRQGSSLNSNAYTIEFFRNAANDHRVRLRKGTIYNSPINDAADFNGTILATSTNVLAISDSTVFCLDIRWRAGVSSTSIEVLVCSITNTLDTSPGTIDYKVVSRFTNTDSSSPYITTSNNPILTIRGSDDAESTKLYQYELRKET